MQYTADITLKDHLMNRYAVVRRNSGGSYNSSFSLRFLTETNGGIKSRPSTHLQVTQAVVLDAHGTAASRTWNAAHRSCGWCRNPLKNLHISR